MSKKVKTETSNNETTIKEVKTEITEVKKATAKKGAEKKEKLSDILTAKITDKSLQTFAQSISTIKYKYEVVEDVKDNVIFKSFKDKSTFAFHKDYLKANSITIQFDKSFSMKLHELLVADTTLKEMHSIRVYKHQNFDCLTVHSLDEYKKVVKQIEKLDSIAEKQTTTVSTVQEQKEA